MAYIGCDGVTPGNIPGRVWAVMGYANGRYQWKDSDWQRFLNSWRLSITVFPVHNGSRILDGAADGNCSIQDDADWALGELWHLRHPTLYENRSTYAPVAAALRGHGLSFGHDVSLWLADPDGAPTLSIPPGFDGMVAKQYGQAPGGAFDLSVVDPLWVQAVASGGPPHSTPPTLQSTVTVFAPSGTFTTDIASIKGGVGLPRSTKVLVEMNGTSFTTDIGTLEDTGLV